MPLSLGFFSSFFANLMIYLNYREYRVMSVRKVYEEIFKLSFALVFSHSVDFTNFFSGASG